MDNPGLYWCSDPSYYMHSPWRKAYDFKFRIHLSVAASSQLKRIDEGLHMAVLSAMKMGSTFNDQRSTLVLWNIKESRVRQPRRQPL
jgi:hypothetical protein